MWPQRDEGAPKRLNINKNKLTVICGRFVDSLVLREPSSDVNGAGEQPLTKS